MNPATQITPATDGQNLVALVPRINIHAFCDNEQTGAAMQAAAADRRMARAHMNVQLGGIMAAVQVYQGQATPNALLVESHGSREQIMSAIKAKNR